MNTANILVATQLLIELLNKATTIGALIRRAQNEGRDITDADLDHLAGGDDAVRKALADAIAAARRD